VFIDTTWLLFMTQVWGHTDKFYFWSAESYIKERPCLKTHR